MKFFLFYISNENGLDIGFESVLVIIVLRFLLNSLLRVSLTEKIPAVTGCFKDPCCGCLVF